MIFEKCSKYYTFQGNFASEINGFCFDFRFVQYTTFTKSVCIYVLNFYFKMTRFVCFSFRTNIVNILNVI